LIALAMVGSACGSPDDRIPGFAFEPVSFPEFRLAALRIRTDKR
jgi:hypothetical protein